MKTLIVFSHTWFKGSKVNRALLEAAQDVKDVTIRNLEELYGQNPEKIDVKVALQQFVGKTKVCHIRTTSRAIYCKEAQACCGDVIQL